MISNQYESTSNSFKNSFLDEWTSLFGRDISFDEIQRHCFGGKLRDSRLRSVIWRVLLKVLPLDRQEWIKIVGHSRKTYDTIKAKLNTNPRASSNQDPDYNNPLSLQNENPWCQFFLDEELRDCIRKDVDRTFPDLQFFQSTKTRIIMSDILFVYAKLNPHIEYRQGMHELLGTIIFAIYFDHRSFEHLNEQNCLEDLSDFDVETLRTLNDPKFLEHDSFALFQQLIMLLEGWFITDSEFESHSPPTAFDEAEPFSSKDNVPNSELLRRLDYINEDLLSKIDPILYRHLKSMDISVQVFGIRWLRLLFIREFHLHDLLFLWDVILSDRPTLNLVDYVFLALLIQIRDLLLHSDYSAALQYLMRYPPIADIHTFVKLVLHLKFPKIYPKPKNCGLPLYSHITLAGTAHPNQNRNVIRAVSTQNGINAKKPAHTTKKNKPVDIILNKLGRHALAASPPNNRDLYVNSSIDHRNTPVKTGRVDVRSKFYVPIEVDQNGQSTSIQSHVYNLQSRTRQAVQRITRVSENLEQQGLPQQGPIIIELRDIASLLNGGLLAEEEEVIIPAPLPLPPPIQLPSRSNSVSNKAADPMQRRPTLSGKDCELMEMNFSKLKNY